MSIEVPVQAVLPPPWFADPGADARTSRPPELASLPDGVKKSLEEYRKVRPGEINILDQDGLLDCVTVFSDDFASCRLEFGDFGGGIDARIVFDIKEGVALNATGFLKDIFSDPQTIFTGVERGELEDIDARLWAEEWGGRELVGRDGQIKPGLFIKDRFLLNVDDGEAIINLEQAGTRVSISYNKAVEIVKQQLFIIDADDYVESITRESQRAEDKRAFQAFLSRVGAFLPPAVAAALVSLFLWGRRKNKIREENRLQSKRLPVPKKGLLRVEGTDTWRDLATGELYDNQGEPIV